MVCAWLWSLCLAPLLSVPTDGSPIRLGVRVAAADLEHGLGLAGRGALQWRRLPVVGERGGSAGQVWIELAILAPRGTARVVRGGIGPSPDGRGAAFVRTSEVRRVPAGTVTVVRWRWCDGTVDQRVRTTFCQDTTLAGERYQAGERLTVDSCSLAHRAAFYCQHGRRLAGDYGLLPPTGRRTVAAARVRRHLSAVIGRLVEMPGRRGAGDFARGSGEVTNLEFDTTLALLRCAVASSDERAWSLALRAATHLGDRDIDPRTGLPFMHGAGHRTALPQVGHVWLQGLLWVGLLTADDDVLALVRSIGQALTKNLPQGTGRMERLRDYAWPLLELERLHAVDPAPQVAAAADRLAVAIEARFDPVARTFRFGEGEVGGGVYFERGWLTSGLLFPALQSHLCRRKCPSLAAKLRLAQRAIATLVGSGARGLPTHWRIRAGRVEAVHTERGSARAGWLLVGLPERSQTRLLGRSSMQRGFAETPPLDHPDLPTEFTLLARCPWVWR